jgi:SAM-dependent methyltransferase
VCGPVEIRVYLTGEHRLPCGETRPYVFFHCPGCGLRFQRVAEEEAVHMYADLEDGHSPFKPSGRPLHCDGAILRAFRRTGANGRLLDVGSGDGRFLAAAKAAGFDCMGTDVSPRLAETAARRSGATVLVGPLADLRLPQGGFDGVNIDQVLMYVADPAGLLAEVRRLLRPGGLCRIREYDPDSLRARLAGSGYWGYNLTRVNLWTRRSIRRLAEGAGLSVARIIPGTEADLKTFLAASSPGGPLRRLARAGGFLARKAGAFGVQVGADTVYYLEKPCG